jgi:sulfate permease, SulP family
VADLLSRPVLVGYLAGVALIMIADQLRRVAGVPVTGKAFFAQLGSFARGVDRAQLATVVLAAAVLVFLLVLWWRWPHAPGALLAVLAATAVTAVFGLARHGIAVVGPVPARLPVPAVPDLHPAVLQELLLPAFTRPSGSSTWPRSAACSPSAALNWPSRWPPAPGCWHSTSCTASWLPLGCP